MAAGGLSSKKRRASTALPPHARSSAKKAKCPPTTGRAMKYSPFGNSPLPSVSYKSVKGRSVTLLRPVSYIFLVKGQG